MSGPPPSPQEPTGRTAARGLAWTGLALIASKLMSFVSQIVLGYVLAVDTYATFALVTTAMIFITGFQSSGASKKLVQQHERLEELLPAYSAYTLWLGLVGLAVFLAVGLVFERIYDIRPLFWVIALAALSVPIRAIGTIQIAVLSLRFDFRAIGMAEIKRSFFYYAVLIAAAVSGAGGYTIALALSASALYHFHLLARVAPEARVSWRLSPARFLRMTVELRWVILAAFLASLGMNGDYLVLGAMLTPEELGYYYFGFMLVISFTAMISVGINQALLPMFSKLQDKLPQLRYQYLRIGGAITLMAALVGLGLVGMGPVLVHLVWGGKWDPAIIVVVLMGAGLPIRLMENLAGTVFEARGAWGWRLCTLLGDAAMILFSAWIGAALGGFAGATIAVALQRLATGLVNFPLAARMIGMSADRILGFLLRNFLVYAVLAGLLIGLDAGRTGAGTGDIAVLPALFETLAALAAFLAFNWVFNREILVTMIDLARRRKAA